MNCSKAHFNTVSYSFFVWDLNYTKVIKTSILSISLNLYNHMKMMIKWSGIKWTVLCDYFFVVVGKDK